MKNIILLISLFTFILGGCKESPNKDIAAKERDSKDSTIQKHLSIERRNIQIVRSSLEAYNAQDVDGFLKDASNDMIDGDPEHPAKGKDSIRKGYVQGFATIANQKGEDLKYFADSDIVMVWGKWRGTWVKSTTAEKATGKSFLIDDVDVFKLSEDGKILAHFPTQNGIEQALQLGHKLK